MLKFILFNLYTKYNNFLNLFKIILFLFFYTVKKILSIKIKLIYIFCIEIIFSIFEYLF